LGAGVDPGFYIGVSSVMYFVTVISVRVCTPCALPLDLPLGVGEASPTDIPFVAGVWIFSGTTQMTC